MYPNTGLSLCTVQSHVGSVQKQNLLSSVQFSESMLQSSQTPDRKHQFQMAGDSL